MPSFATCLRNFLQYDLPIPTRPPWTRYTIMYTRISLRLRRMQTISTILAFFRFQRRRMAKMGITDRNLPPRSPTLMRMLNLEMTWMGMTSEATQRATTRARMEH